MSGSVSKNNAEFDKRRYPYYREVWRGGPDKVRKYYLESRDSDSFKTIKNSGLAKKSWIWMMPGVRGSGMSNFAAEVSKRRTPVSLEIEMANKLSYIHRALSDSEGRILLHEALGVAARQLEKNIDKKLERLAR
jgi:hypothetical protein